MKTFCILLIFIFSALANAENKNLCPTIGSRVSLRGSFATGAVTSLKGSKAEIAWDHKMTTTEEISDLAFSVKCDSGICVGNRVIPLGSNPPAIGVAKEVFEDGSAQVEWRFLQSTTTATLTKEQTIKLARSIDCARKLGANGIYEPGSLCQGDAVKAGTLGEGTILEAFENGMVHVSFEKPMKIDGIEDVAGLNKVMPSCK